MAEKSIPTRHDMLLNKTALLVYWLCATDSNLLDKVLSDGRAPLTRLGIPPRYIHGTVLNNLKENQHIFYTFSQYVIVPRFCPKPPCWRRSLKAMIKDILGTLFG